MIYILDNDPKKTAKYLDDKSLDRQIKDIAQVLCNVHYYWKWVGPVYHVPLKSDFSKKYGDWSSWAGECGANYDYLLNLLDFLLWEQLARVSPNPLKTDKYVLIYKWAFANVPDLPECHHGYCKKRVSYDGEEGFGFICEYTKTFKYCHEKYGTELTLPLVMPKKYIEADLTDMVNKSEFGSLLNGTIIAYRNYYRAKLKHIYKNKMRYVSKAGNTLPEGSYFERQKELSEKIKWTRREKPEWLIL